MIILKFIFRSFLILGVTLTSCIPENSISPVSKKNEPNTEQEPPIGPPDISMISQFFHGPIVTPDKEEIVFESTGAPDHPSSYFETSNALYEAYIKSGFSPNPYKIKKQSLTLTIQRFPAKDSNHVTVPAGIIGLTVNGVAIFNQNSDNGGDLESEFSTFDKWSGHTQEQGMYHYHTEPKWLTNINGNEALIGVLLDGYPVYGTHENGQKIFSKDLDEFHGHIGPTIHFPNGIYHYHVTEDAPYINGGRFYGTMGTVSN